MRYFPMFLDSRGLQVLIVGGGEIACRKAELLLKTEAKVTVVATHACQSMLLLVQSHDILLHQRPFADADLKGHNLVFVATNDAALNQAISARCKALNIFANVVDQKDACHFITPSIIDRSPIIIAMSSGGAAPVLLRYLRQKLETTLPAGIARLGALAQQFRDRVKARFNSVDERRRFWEDIFEGPIAEDASAGLTERAEKALSQRLEEQRAGVHGAVYLVGAGPGDPDLLTFRAIHLMQKADVVVYDRLVSPGVLELVRRDAEKLYVGKARSNHSLPQQDINALLVHRARQGQTVVRLKGGDPFIFGRGGEELDALVEAAIPFQVVPGITAASGASTYAGIPLTHRDHAQAVIFATGHLQDDSIDLDWPALARPNQTLVFYMGLTGLGLIARQLTRHGLDTNTPVALVQSATTEDQRVLISTLTKVAKEAEEHAFGPPTLIIVGSVVSLHNRLNWRD